MKSNAQHAATRGALAMAPDGVQSRAGQLAGDHAVVPHANAPKAPAHVATQPAASRGLAMEIAVLLPGGEAACRPRGRPPRPRGLQLTCGRRALYSPAPFDHPGSPIMKTPQISRQTAPASVERGLGFVLLALSLVGLVINFLQ